MGARNVVILIAAYGFTCHKTHRKNFLRYFSSLLYVFPVYMFTAYASRASNDNDIFLLVFIFCVSICFYGCED